MSSIPVGEYDPVILCQSRKNWNKIKKRKKQYYNLSWSESIPLIYCLLVFLYFWRSIMWRVTTSSNTTSLQNLDFTFRKAASNLSLCLVHKEHKSSILKDFSVLNPLLASFSIRRTWSHRMCSNGSLFFWIATSMLLSTSENLHSLHILSTKWRKVVLCFWISLW